MTAPTATRNFASRALGTDISAARTVDEALHMANLDWTIEEHPADSFALTTEDGVTMTGMPGMRFFLRSDTKEALHLGGARYTPVTNADAFASAEAAVAMGARFATGGAIRGGRQTYLELDLPDANVEVGGKDLVTFQLLLRTAHDGSGRVTGEARARRLVCTNGMTANIGFPTHFAIGHTRSAHDRLAAASTMVQGAVRYAKEFAAIADHMLDTPMTRTEFAAFIDALYPQPDEENAREYGRWESRRHELIDLFRFADTNDLGRGSRWGAYSALTEHLDWFTTVRGGDDARALRQLDNTAQGMKDRALQILAAV
ncbi:DUF932 domain-containing protein [Prescottella agglutinans]|uniref:Phage/plasmid-like protein (TIGR03299 family) n=1 Tax=Prescottella agglutinans TaxID=1644129 RepID=A0ABT6MHY8_9NOCA|nr:DUF932 domain-containing protein [Prescottella agglutinans]MDH6283951.1 phage/plasmid-like protein (TIGR03299 family) [Prescottella agglutinans]